MDILHDLNTSWESDPLIDEIGIVMGNSPPHVILVEHKLGLMSSSLKPLFKYCLQQFNQELAAVDSTSNLKTLLELTRAILIVRGDFPRAFSFRKRMIIDKHLNCKEELDFLNVLFTRHPKSPSSWEHRRWLFSITHSFDVDSELSICTRMAEQYPRNYYAWTHRTWLLNHLDEAQCLKELSFTTKWMYGHVTDHSCTSYREQIVSLLLRKKNIIERLRFFGDLLDESLALIVSRPGSESLWYHRRNLCSILLDWSHATLTSSEHAFVFQPMYLARVDMAVSWPRACDFSLLANAQQKQSVPASELHAIDRCSCELWLRPLPTPSTSTEGISLPSEADEHRVTLAPLARGVTDGFSTVKDPESVSYWYFKWLISWLQEEIAACLTCFASPSRWNTSKQHQGSLQHVAYLLFKVKRLLSLFPDLFYGPSSHQECRDAKLEIESLYLSVSWHLQPHCSCQLSRFRPKSVQLSQSDS